MANLSPDASAEATITLNPPAVHHSGIYNFARDAVSDETLPIDDKQVFISCAPMGWRLIEVRLA